MRRGSSQQAIRTWSRGKPGNTQVIGVWRGDVWLNTSVAGPFVWRCLTDPAVSHRHFPGQLARERDASAFLQLIRSATRMRIRGRGHFCRACWNWDMSRTQTKWLSGAGNTGRRLLTPQRSSSGGCSAWPVAPCGYAPPSALRSPASFARCH
jgi:hypothetical protein